MDFRERVAVKEKATQLEVCMRDIRSRSVLGQFARDLGSNQDITVDQGARSASSGLTWHFSSGLSRLSRVASEWCFFSKWRLR